jgi:TolA-binding protein
LPAPPALDEASLMAKLRELRGSSPELTLALSRQAQARFKNSPDAAEQSWFVVKSLTDLGRHDEARVEGKKLVKDYPGTRWAEDAHRHLFVNPATHPAERGYGKDLDL